MAIDKESSGYTLGFAVVLVVVVGALLSFTAMKLKPYQQENQKREKMVNILKCIGVEATMENAEENFNKYITKRTILDASGAELASVQGPVTKGNADDGFNVNVKKEFRSLKLENRKYPVYECNKDEKTYYVIPLVGKGLWGPIWGFIALNSDKNTVYGATFDHKTETPGLGAEINQAWFQEPFIGKKVFKEDQSFGGITVQKGGADPADLHAVDAVTGGTITSDGVTEMLQRTLKIYVPYLKN